MTKWFDWKRFWLPRGQSVNLSLPGYLLDPEAAQLVPANPDAISLDTLASVPCLILLGEPGLGKSAALDAERYRLTAAGQRTLSVDLKAYQTDARLVAAVFGSSELRQWLDGRDSLYFLLDGLDESTIPHQVLGRTLIDEIRQLPRERLFVRLACRTADWPGNLDEPLKDLWSEGGVGFYELLPLRQRDVAQAAQVSGLDPVTFLQAIEEKQVGPFAARPVTLRFLLNLYRERQDLPRTQTELYLQGCRLLCEEVSQTRRDSKQIGTLDSQQRLLLAGRIAAYTVFTNRFAIWTGVEDGTIPETDIAINDLGGDAESVAGGTWIITEAMITETLSTPLFSTYGLNRVGWAHQTYAEFLAAWYLTQRDVDPSQLESLIFDPSQLKIVPQLYSVTAWLAGLSPKIRQKVARAHPEVLLRGDIAQMSPEFRAQLVDALIDLYSQDEISQSEFELRRHYHKLTHPQLASQLKPYIEDSTQNLSSRHFTLDLVEDCRLEELYPNLIQLALNPAEPHALRVNAAFTVSLQADDGIKAQLKPLIFGQAGDDPHDELKGCGLTALWPKHLSGEELFQVLELPLHEGFFGIYDRFIRHDLVRNLQPSDLPLALAWTERYVAKQDDVFKKIHRAALLHIDNPQVQNALARSIVARLHHYDDVFGEATHFESERYENPLRTDISSRRKLLRSVLELIRDPKDIPFGFMDWRAGLVGNEDFTWLIELFDEPLSGLNRKVLADVISWVIDRQNDSQLEMLYFAAQRYPELADIANPLFKAVTFGTPEAERMKKYYLVSLERQQDQVRPLVQPPPAERIAGLLSRCETREPCVWWQLNMELTLQVDSQHYGDEKVSDLTILPGWQSADPGIRLRILRTGQEYLLRCDPTPGDGIPEHWRPALAGYRALRLLSVEDPNWLANLPTDTWRKWVSITVTFPISDEDGDVEAAQGLVKLAYAHAPDEVLASLSDTMDRQGQNGFPITVVQTFKACWDRRITQCVVTKALSPDIQAGSLSSLLAVLLECALQDGQQVVQTWLEQQRNDDRLLDCAVAAAMSLLSHEPRVNWSTVWAIVQQDAELGRALVSALAHGQDRLLNHVGRHLSEVQVADLYQWLVSQFPYSEDPHIQGFHSVSPRESVAHWRDALLHHLKMRGTPQACQALERMMAQFPELQFLKKVLHDALEITRQNTWLPPSPRHFRQLLRRQESRLVQSGEQLLGVIEESLNRLNIEAQGETRGVIAYWNQLELTLWRPKTEDDLSDLIKLHLERDLKGRGIVANREVVIRKTTGGAPGERTDIHVDAMIRLPNTINYDVITVIIEVKGCWHDDVASAMETQLVRRYLRDNQCRYGLYVVGWFNCPQWDQSDSRQLKAAQHTKEALADTLAEQALRLSESNLQIRAFVLDLALR